MAKRRKARSASKRQPRRREQLAGKRLTRARVSAGPRAAAVRAEDTLSVTFDLRDIADQPLSDPEARFTFRRLTDNRQIGSQIKRAVKGAPVAFDLPVVAGEAVLCDFDLLRFRFATSPIFFRTPGPPISRTCTLLREPKQWTPDFTRWSGLTEAFEDLKKVLGTSEDVMLFKTDRSLNKIVEDEYDELSDQGDDVVMAKTALLNIYFRLRTAHEPVSGDPWFSFVKQIHSIGRERFLAFVDPVMEERVRQIDDHIGQFPDYEKTDAEIHRGNVPQEMQGRIDRMVSIKSSDAKSNFQLTLTKLTNPDELLLDADIDENGQLLAHFLDLFKHKITGGTFPVDVHELLVLQFGSTPGFDLGYRLV